MKLISSLIAFLGIVLFSFKIIELKKFYVGQGVIFDASVKYPFTELDYYKPITPRISEIKSIEFVTTDHCAN